MPRKRKTNSRQRLLSVIVPIYNESANIAPLYRAVTDQLKNLDYDYELMFVDDGSDDDSLERLAKIAKRDKKVRVLEFARNFGKESAVTAGLHSAAGDAVILMDADLQHPPDRVKQFVSKWENGSDVVVGLRRYSNDEGWLKRKSSALFYRLFGMFSDTNITPHATDFRLLDRSVVDTYNELSEHSRITRGLIDWLGYRRSYIKFEAPPRLHGEASYSFTKLFKLAVDTFTAHSLVPLKLAGYLGLVILLISGPLGLFMAYDKYISSMGSFNFTGTAMLAVIILFLVGIILASLGLISLYVARIHEEVMGRPLYVVRREISEEESDEKGGK
jgi:glycosyltransferase involved in cell wall biosynthesis